MESQGTYTVNHTRKKVRADIPVNTTVKASVNYNQKHLRDFLVSHPAINISFIESLCKLPKDTLRHFLKDRRNIPLKSFSSVETSLIDYGYKPLETE